MQYQVLARKWRPQNFNELVGQDHVSRTLLNALQSGRVAHAFLFSGPRGSGKTTTARILAKALNCHDGKAGEPCGKCVACVEIAAGNCMDVLEIDAASNTGVDNVRDLIEELHYKPARDRNKIYIIDEVHMLSTAAFNALLKTLEEPPPHVVFIMATTEYHKIPATILSRCQQYSFKLIRFPLILKRLQSIAEAENIRVSTQSLEQIAFSSGGSMRDAMSAFDQVIAFSGQTVNDDDVPMLLGLVAPSLLGKTVRSIAACDVEAILDTVSELTAAGQDLQNFCRSLLGQFRDLMVLKSGVSDPFVLGVPESLLPDLMQQAGLFSREDLLRLFDALLKVEADLRHAIQTRFQLEMGLIELAQIPKMRALEEVIADFTRLVGGGTPSGIPAGRPATAAPAPGRAAPPANNALSEAKEQSRPVPAARKDVPTEPPRVEMPAPADPAPTLAQGSAGTRELLEKIASAVQKESLEPILHSLAGAKVQGDAVVLDLGVAPNEFLRKQLKDNLAVIAQAASTVVGRNVEVLMDDMTPVSQAPTRPGTPAAGAVREEDVLERARREPAVKSFLDTFPGPVKAEKIKP